MDAISKPAKILHDNGYFRPQSLQELCYLSLITNNRDERRKMLRIPRRQFEEYCVNMYREFQDKRKWKKLRALIRKTVKQAEKEIKAYEEAKWIDYDAKAP